MGHTGYVVKKMKNYRCYLFRKNSFEKNTFVWQIPFFFHAKAFPLFQLRTGRHASGGFSVQVCYYPFFTSSHSLPTRGGKDNYSFRSSLFFFAFCENALGISKILIFKVPKCLVWPSQTCNEALPLSARENVNRPIKYKIPSTTSNFPLSKMARDTPPSDFFEMELFFCCRCVGKRREWKIKLAAAVFSRSLTVHAWKRKKERAPFSFSPVVRSDNSGENKGENWTKKKEKPIFS